MSNEPEMNAVRDFARDCASEILKLCSSFRRGAAVYLDPRIEEIYHHEGSYSFLINGDMWTFVIDEDTGGIYMGENLVSIMSPLDFRNDVLSRDLMTVARSPIAFEDNHVPLMFPLPTEGNKLYLPTNVFSDRFLERNGLVAHCLLYIINDHFNNYEGSIFFTDRDGEGGMGMLIDADGVVEFFGDEEGNINKPVMGESLV